MAKQSRIAVVGSAEAEAITGSFAVFLAEGRPDKEALTRASLYAALSTTRAGTQEPFVNRSDYDQEWQSRGSRWHG
jgi:sugar/nucleoside kinase (ribokinase family)